MSCHTEKKDNLNKLPIPSDKSKKIALIGNPNVGKSQIFNLLTNSHELVGNFPGITVSTAIGVFKSKTIDVLIYDLPGTYSLTNSNNVEIITRNWIIENNPDLIMNVVDSSNLERNLLLTLILMEFNIPLVLVLNMFDIAQGKGFSINVDALQEELKIPVFQLVAVKKSEKAKFKKWFENQIITPPDNPDFPNYDQKIVQPISELHNAIFPDLPLAFWYTSNLIGGKTENISQFYEKINVFEKETEKHHLNTNNTQLQITNKRIDRFKAKFPDLELSLMKERHRLIKKILSKVQVKIRKDRSLTQQLDLVLTNKFLGIPIFFLLIWIMFQFTFEISRPFTDYILVILNSVSIIVESILSPIPNSELVISFINDGLISGIGTVISFLPIVFFLFIVIAILEDSGYFSRGSFIIDKLMVQFGMEGRSFVPMVLGFGCNIPGVLSTRNIEGKRERLLTISILPFMSCSARLPIYILFGTLFFYQDATVLILFLYFLGVVAGLLVILLFKFILKKKNYYSTPLILEMPPYILPNFNSVLTKAVTQARSFIKKITSIVLLGSAIIWILSHILLNPLTIEASPIYDQTLLGILGKFIQPIFAPLGFNWKLVIALIFGLMAKEVIISTIGILYIAGSSMATGQLANILSKDPSLTPLVALTYMVFVLLYIPCIATLGIIKSETNKKYASFVIIYTFVVAYAISWLFYTVGSLLL